MYSGLQLSIASPSESGPVHSDEVTGQPPTLSDPENHDWNFVYYRVRLTRVWYGPNGNIQKVVRDVMSRYENYEDGEREGGAPPGRPLFFKKGRKKKKITRPALKSPPPREHAAQNPLEGSRSGPLSYGDVPRMLPARAWAGVAGGLPRLGRALLILGPQMKQMYHPDDLASMDPLVLMRNLDHVRMTSRRLSYILQQQVHLYTPEANKIRTEIDQYVEAERQIEWEMARRGLRS